MSDAEVFPWTDILNREVQFTGGPLHGQKRELSPFTSWFNYHENGRVYGYERVGRVKDTLYFAWRSSERE